jgi:signal transduction histidine kinase
LGELPRAPDLGDQATAVRAMQGYGALFGAIASASEPVVVFLDDLQWADLASLDLVEFLLAAHDIRGLLLIGGLRDDDLAPGDPLARMRARIEASGRPTVTIRLGPLDLAATTALVADACRTTTEGAVPLAAALRERTGGNPFFLLTLLSQMHERGLLLREGAGFRCSAHAAEQLGFADNVVDVVLERMAALPEDTARALGVAARIGHVVRARLLARALDRTAAEVVVALAPAVEAGLLRPEGEAWGLLAWGGPSDATDEDGPTCRFVHDRVQEAALRLLPAADAPAMHLRLARILTRPANPTGDTLFAALEHYRAALALVDEDERAVIARLALDASAAAVRSTAFDVALRACELGLLALERKDPALWEALHARAVEIADAQGDGVAVERHAAALIAGASSLAASAPAYVARIRALTREKSFDAAIATSNAFLSRVGRRTRTRLAFFPLLFRLARVLWAIRGRTPEQLVEGPLATDPLHVAVMSVRVAVLTALASAHPQVMVLDVLTHMDEVLTRGVTRDGVYVWTGWAILLAEGLGRAALAIRYCELALARAERMGAGGRGLDIAKLLYGFLYHHQAPLAEVAVALHRTRDQALARGDLGSVIEASLMADHINLAKGEPLAEVELALRRTQDLLRQYRVDAWASLVEAFLHAVGVLRGRVEIGELPGVRASDSSFEQQTHAFVQVMLAAFLGDRETGLRAARLTPQGIDAPLHPPLYFVWWTYRAVAILRAAEAGLVSPREARRLVRPGRRRLERWARTIAGRRYHLLWIDGADAALGGDPAAALRLYDEAIDLARSMGVRHDAALLAEHAAEVAEAAGQRRLSRVFLEEASAGYRQWGADAKADLVAKALPLRATGASLTTTSSATLAGDLDLETLFRASIALSGEIRLDRLVAEVVAVTIQNAGATRGFLVIERDGELTVVLGRDAEGAVLAAPGAPLSMVDALAGSVVRYVARTGEQLVLADAGSDARFAGDPYLGAGGRSILCTPLDHKGKRTGLIYLENDLVTGGFTAARLRTVQVLASQAAVAIENASLVDNLEGKVDERTQALSAALERTRAQHEQLVSSQQALVQSEKMAALGQLVAGVAHELNTPLGAIRASVGNLSNAMVDLLGGLLELLTRTPPEERAAWLALVHEASARTAPRTSREERAARRTIAAWLRRSGVAGNDDLAALLVEIGLDGEDGELDAHVALLHAERRDELLRGAYDVTAIARNSQNIRTAADRASKIVFALKSYAHPGGAEGESARASLADNLDIVLTLYGNQIKHNVDLVRDYQDPGVVDGRHDELNQVWTNLVHNALQAMDHRGRLEVSVRAAAGDVLVAITDSGRGIAEAHKDRIFEPFFTTKAAGEGSGLGLSICRDIVQKHAGSIAVESQPGRTRFTVRLPAASAQEAEGAP